MTTRMVRNAAANHLVTVPPHGSTRLVRGRNGFTMIELLVVIGVIAILATLIIGVFSHVYEKKLRARVRTELEMLTSLISNYHEKKGFYPPGNANPANPGTNQLFYELVGSATNANDQFVTVNWDKAIARADIKNTFGVDGFLNARFGDDDPKNFAPDLRPGQFAPLPGTDVQLLVVGVKGPGGDFNPWRYDASSPNRHNHDSFDLWAEVTLGSKTIVIGNWKD